MNEPQPPAGRSGDAIHAENVTKSFPVGRTQGVDVLRGISLRARHGELVAVMGPSGSGKSTLMYCLAGLEQPSSGTVTLTGHDTASMSRAQLARMRRSDVGFLFQSYNLVPTLSALDNAALPFLLGRRPVPRERVVTALTGLGLEHRLAALPPTMSGGEQQRVALARVLAQRPTVVFADEPTGALDTRSGVKVMDSLTAMAHEEGTCVVLVTHDPSVAARCDRVLFLRDGLLLREYTAAGTEDLARTLAEDLATQEVA